MTRELTRVGNASSLHGSGRAARRIVEESREAIAARRRSPAGRGDLHLRRHRGRQPRGQGRLLVPGRRGTRGLASSPRPSSIHAVLDSVGWLAQDEPAPSSSWSGSTESAGSIWPGWPRRVTETTAVVSVMWANNEVGTVQPVTEIAALAARPRGDLAQRRGAGGRPPARRLRRERSRPDDLHRPQARRPVRDRRAARPPRGRAHHRPARRRTGARRPVRHARRRRGRRLRGRGRRGRGPAGEPRRRGCGRFASRSGRRGPGGRARRACSRCSLDPADEPAGGAQPRLPGLRRPTRC